MKTEFTLNIIKKIGKVIFLSHANVFQMKTLYVYIYVYSKIVIDYINSELNLRNSAHLCLKV